MTTTAPEAIDATGAPRRGRRRESPRPETPAGPSLPGFWIACPSWTSPELQEESESIRLALELSHLSKATPGALHRHIEALERFAALLPRLQEEAIRHLQALSDVFPVIDADLRKRAFEFGFTAFGPDSGVTPPWAAYLRHRDIDAHREEAEATRQLIATGIKAATEGVAEAIRQTRVRLLRLRMNRPTDQ